MTTIAFVSLLAACAGDAPSESTAPTLSIDSASATSGLQATLQLAGEHIAIDSRTTTISGVGADDDGNPLVEPDYSARVTTVTSEDGTRYAQWTVPIDHYEASGTLGGQPFGTVASADTDMDPSYWQPIASGHAGEVLAALATLAQPLAGASEYASVAANVQDLANMSSVLQDMAQPPAITAHADCTPEEALLDETVSPKSSTTCYDKTEASTLGVCSGPHYWVSIWNRTSRLVVKYGTRDAAITKAVAKAQTVYRRGHYGDDQGHSLWGPMRSIGVPSNCNFFHEWCDKGNVAGCG